jgi:hypothetical protein
VIRLLGSNLMGRSSLSPAAKGWVSGGENSGWLLFGAGLCAARCSGALPQGT